MRLIKTIIAPMEQSLPDKHDVAALILMMGPLVVSFDPRKFGVVAPICYDDVPYVSVVLGSFDADHQSDLRFNDRGWYGTAMFASGDRSLCYVPWYAVFAMSSLHAAGEIWDADVPPEFKTSSEHRPSLRVVK